MSIQIDSEKCTGCGQCLQVCPGNLLYKDNDGKSVIKYSKDCWGCTSCVKECRFNAIRYYLGADIGGRGSFMYVKEEGPLLHWIVIDPSGRQKVITTDRSQANAY